MILSPSILLFLGALFVFAFLSWRQCVFTVLWLLLVEGAFRKWFFPQASDVFYFLKDGLILIAYAKYALSQESRIKTLLPQGLQISILLCVLLVFMLTLLPSLGSPIIGLFGARNYLLYLPLLFLGKDLFHSEADLMRFLRLYLLASLPLFALALVQYSSPMDAAINQLVADSGAQGGMVGNRMRVASSFSYIAGYACYLQIVIALVLPLLLIEAPPLWRYLFRLIFICAVGGIMLTGSRGPALLTLIIIGLYVLLNQEIRRRRLVVKVLFSVVFCVVFAVLWLSTAFENYSSRIRSNQDIGSRIISYFANPLEYTNYAGLLGYGPGATFQATQRIRNKLELPAGEKIPVYYESEPERVMLELGILGFFLWYGIRVSLLGLLWITYRSLHAPFLRELALVVFLIHLTSLPHLMVFQVTFMVYYWFFAGFILLLPALERKAAST